MTALPKASRSPFCAGGSTVLNVAHSNAFGVHSRPQCLKEYDATLAYSLIKPFKMIFQRDMGVTAFSILGKSVRKIALTLRWTFQSRVRLSSAQTGWSEHHFVH